MVHEHGVVIPNEAMISCNSSYSSCPRRSLHPELPVIRNEKGYFLDSIVSILFPKAPNPSSQNPKPPEV